jgi:hypothetical protein
MGAMNAIKDLKWHGLTPIYLTGVFLLFVIPTMLFLRDQISGFAYGACLAVVIWVMNKVNTFYGIMPYLVLTNKHKALSKELETYTTALELRGITYITLRPAIIESNVLLPTVVIYFTRRQSGWFSYDKVKCAVTAGRRIDITVPL